MDSIPVPALYLITTMEFVTNSTTLTTMPAQHSVKTSFPVTVEMLNLFHLMSSATMDFPLSTSGNDAWQGEIGVYSL